MAVFVKIVAFEYYFKSIVEWSGRHLTPAGGRGKAETPQAKSRRLGFLPGESCVWSAMERPAHTFNWVKKQQSMRKRPKLLIIVEEEICLFCQKKERMKF
jgi:hypothetical protein